MREATNDAEVAWNVRAWSARAWKVEPPECVDAGVRAGFVILYVPGIFYTCEQSTCLGKWR